MAGPKREGEAAHAGPAWGRFKGVARRPAVLSLPPTQEPETVNQCSFATCCSSLNTMREIVHVQVRGALRLVGGCLDRAWARGRHARASGGGPSPRGHQLTGGRQLPALPAPQAGQCGNQIGAKFWEVRAGAWGQPGAGRGP